MFVAFYAWQRIRLPRHTSRRAPASYLGLALQGVGYALAFFEIQRGPFAWVGGRESWVQAAVAGLAAAVALASTWVSLAAASALGRQWSFTAQIQREHRLITTGPYARVRHPIYLSMMGMLWASGLMFGGPVLLAAGTAFYLAGFALRARCEDKLLAEAFGAEFGGYRRQVPALIPRIRRARELP